MKRATKKVVKSHKMTELETWFYDTAKTTVAWSVVNADKGIKITKCTLSGARAGWAEGMKQIKK